MNEKNIYDCTSIINVKNKLNLKEVWSSGNIIYVHCPFCASNNGSLKLDITNNSYICKKCEESGYSVGLYAKLKFISNKSAYKELISDEPNMECNINRNILVNNKRNEDELDCIYQEFLNMLDLSPDHIMKLLKIGFSIETINKIGFKSIPENEDEKFNICKKLIEDGYELKGIPGFHQNKNFKWTFKSHPGIFIPIRNNGKINSLRIHLDKEYSNETTDIWFSSGDKFNGTKASNGIMILYPKKDVIQLFNNKESKEIIMVSEMLLAYKVFEKYKDFIVVAIPNVISKSEIKKLDSLNEIYKIHLIIEEHTLKYNTVGLLSTLNKKFDNNIISNYFSFNNEIPKEFSKIFDATDLKEKIA